MTVTAPTLGTVSLEELNAAAALQSRIDNKFLIPVSDLDSFHESLPPGTRILQIDGSTSLDYYSVYFDTEDWLLYRWAATRRRRRIKVRTRLYVNTDTAFVEVKKKGHRGITDKRRIEYSSPDIFRLDGAARAFIGLCLQSQRLPFALSRGLQPVLTTRYYRRTYLVPEPAGVPPSRITVDTDLQWELLAPWNQMRAVPNPALENRTLAIIETKSATANSAANRCLWDQGVRQVPMSKYCVGAAALDRALPANRWHRVLQTFLSSSNPQGGNIQ